MIRNSTSRFLHPPGREGKKKQVNKEFGKELQKHSGGDWKTSEEWPMQTPIRAQSSPSQVYRDAYPASAGNPQTSVHQKELIFPFEDTDTGSGNPCAQQELNDDNATKRNPDQKCVCVCTGIKLSYHLLYLLSIC